MIKAFAEDMLNVCTYPAGNLQCCNDLEGV